MGEVVVVKTNLALGIEETGESARKIVATQRSAIQIHIIVETEQR